MGTLKEEQSLASLKIKPGQTVMLMGTADVVVAPATPVLSVSVTFLFGVCSPVVSSGGLRRGHDGGAESREGRDHSCWPCEPS